MAGLLGNTWDKKTYTARGGETFNVNDQGFRVNPDGTLYRPDYEKQTGLAAYGLTGDIDPNTRTMRVDQNGGVYFNGIETAHIDPETGAVMTGARTPEAPAVASWTPTTREVRPEDTVAYQMSNLLKENSPYLQEAEKGAQRTANTRGLLNSSIAAGAGRGAAINAAMPIATQDAATYFSQGQSNQNVTNQAGQYNAGALNTANLASYGTKADIYKMGVGQKNDLEKLTIGQKNDLEKLQIAQQYNIETMTEEQKNTLERQNLANLQDLQKMGVAQGYNLENLNQQQINDLAKMAAAQGYNIATLNAQQVNDLARIAAQGSQQQAQITLQGEINKQLATLDNQFKVSLAEGDDARLRSLEAAKNSAALNAQYIQAAGAINQSDMSVQDKRAQLDTLRQDTNNAIRDTYRMFMPNASEEEVQAAVNDANATQDSLEAINERLDQISRDISGG